MRVTTGTEAGRPTFTLQGQNGSYTMGWVVHPATARIDATDPVRVQVHGADAQIWVVLQVGKGAPPTARVLGQGLGSVLHLNHRVVRLDAATDRLVVEPAPATER